MHPWIGSLVAEEHRRLLLDLAERGRLARSARGQRGTRIGRFLATAGVIAGVQRDGRWWLGHGRPRHGTLRPDTLRAKPAVRIPARHNQADRRPKSSASERDTGL